MTHLDLTGKVFGHLRVLSERKRCLWLCACDCGGQTEKTSKRLKADQRIGRLTTCERCARRIRIQNLPRSATTRERHLPGNNPRAPGEAITPHNYVAYLSRLTVEQLRRYIRIVLRHRPAARDEYWGMDAIRAEAVEAVILEPDGAVVREVETREVYDYRWAYAE